MPPNQRPELLRLLLQTTRLNPLHSARLSLDPLQPSQMPLRPTDAGRPHPREPQQLREDLRLRGRGSSRESEQAEAGHA